MTRADVMLVVALIGMALLVGWAVVAHGAEAAGTAEEQDPPIGWCRCPR